MKLAWVAIASLALVNTVNAGTYLMNVSNGASLATPDPFTLTDIGNHCDNCTTLVNLPFTYQLFGSLFSSVVVSSNGNIQFGVTQPASSTSSANGFPNASLGMSILGYQGNLTTLGGSSGIFTSTSGGGSIFNIEWRDTYIGRSGSAHWEIQLIEGATQFNVIFASVFDSGQFETIGVQSGSGDNTFYSNLTASVPNGKEITFFGHQPVVTPEPTSASLLALGGGLLFLAGRLRKRVRG